MTDLTKMNLLIAIDLSAIYWRAAEVTGPDTPLNTAKQTTIETISRIASNFPPSTPVVICCDSRTNWRKKVDAQYKENRERKGDGFYQELERTKDRLRKDGYPVIESDGYEADDVIASIVKTAGQSTYHVLICSPDKDLLQLVGPSVSQLRTHDMFDEERNLKIWDESAVLDKFGVLPNKLRDWLAITGDDSDNVPGIKGVGGKGAAAVIAEFGSLNTLFTVVEAAQKAGINPFQDKSSLSRWIKPLCEYFLAPDQTVERTDRMARNMILVSLKPEVDIKIDEITKPRKMEDIVKEMETMDTVVLPPEIDAEVETEKTTAITVAQGTDPRDQFDAQLVPTGMRGAYWLANRAVNSRLYERFGSPERALMAIIRGKDYGLSASASLEMLQVIDGKICPPSQTLQAMAKRHPDCEYFAFKEVSPTSATAITKRKGTPFEESCTYTIEQAKAAGLVRDKSGWQKNPEDMLVARAGAKLARRVYPEATLGSYSFEEMDT